MEICSLIGHSSLLILSILILFQWVEGQEINSVKDLEAIMYHDLEAAPCVRLLSVNGEVGCSNPGRVSIEVPIQRITGLNDRIRDKTAILLPIQIFFEFLNRTVSDNNFAEKVSGVLLEYTPTGSTKISAFSPFSKSPQAEFLPYGNKTHVWNPLGTESFERKYNFPIFSLSRNATIRLREAAARNEARAFKPPLEVVRLDAVMTTTRGETGDSKSCLENGNCLPLGGFSVVSLLPPISPHFSPNSPPKPLILCVAQMDSKSFFRDEAIGADSPISGLVALLATAQILSKLPEIENSPFQLGFLVLTGESFGYLGSRQVQFQTKKDNSNSSFLGEALSAILRTENIHAFLEIGPIGKSFENGKIQLFAHPAAKNGQILPATAKILSVLSRYADIIKVDLNISSQSESRIPPSSLASFLHQSPSLPGVFLSEFDSKFKNNFFQSRFDSIERISPEPISRASLLLSQTLLNLAQIPLGQSQLATWQSPTLELVNSLLTCFASSADSSPGQQKCQLAEELMTPRKGQKIGFGGRYVGVLSSVPEISSDSVFVPDVEELTDSERFVWNFLANATGNWPGIGGKLGGKEGKNRGTCSEECEGEGEVCVGSKVDKKGKCLLSTTRYIPSYSPRLKYDNENEKWILLPVPDDDNEMDRVDPVWTESFWREISIQNYLREDKAFEWLLLGVGILTTSISVVLVSLAQSICRKNL